jgi:hypothetical protein
MLHSSSATAHWALTAERHDLPKAPKGSRALPPEQAAVLGMRAVLTRVQRWRAKADELRAVADTFHDAVARDALLEMAHGYERLAHRLEAREIGGQGRDVEPE